MGLSRPLSDEELGRLKELAVAGRRGLIKTGRRGFGRTVKRRYVQERPAGVDQFLCVLTDRSRRVLAGEE
jgi:hypothetical protein